MPRSKDPFARLQRISDIFQTRSSAQAVIKAGALAEELNISLRQLRSDMDALREKGAPLEYDPVLKGWRFTPGEYFTIMDHIPLTGEDLAGLRIAVETLAKVNSLKGFEHLPTIFGKIHRAARRWTGGEASMTGKFVYFDPLPRYDGVKYLPIFLESIEHKRIVQFQYQPFHSEVSKLVVLDPYFLRHYEGRWYVGGYSHDPSEGFVRVFPLERILGQPENIGYCHNKPRDYNAASYWKYIYGITMPPDGKIETVELEFSALQAKYFLSSPFFEPFEVLDESSAYLVVSFRLIINNELIRKLASFGAAARVLSPPSLVNKMRKFHEDAAANLNLRRDE
jgi:predicted DNA-binding transcriptional regulator YafY